MDLGNLRNTVLFKSMSEDELKECLKGCSARVSEYSKGTVILFSGEPADVLGLVLKGSVTVESNDVWGNRTVLSIVGKGQLFAETYAVLKDQVMLVDAVANEDCTCLMLSIKEAMKDTPSVPWKNKLMMNLLLISAHKNLTLSERRFHTSPKSARGRILSYLNTEALKAGTDEFDIPFDRQQMADYLNLERTNMAKELGRMQREGILRFRKNHFKLIRSGISD